MVAVKSICDVLMLPPPHLRSGLVGPRFIYHNTLRACLQEKNTSKIFFVRNPSEIVNVHDLKGCPNVRFLHPDGSKQAAPIWERLAGCSSRIQGHALVSPLSMRGVVLQGVLAEPARLSYLVSRHKAQSQAKRNESRRQSNFDKA